MDNPIEIKASDLIRRPGVLLPGQQVVKEFGIKDVKNVLSQIKEFVELAQGLGLNIPFLPGHQRKEAAAPAPTPAPANPGQQAMLFIQLLQMKYGDCTVNEAMTKLKADFGEWKLSDFRGQP